jgi:hypothetical protein
VPRSVPLNAEQVRSAARSHTLSMLKVLVGVANEKTAPPSARVAAANSVLDRGWGRPDQVHAGPDGGAIQVIIRQVVDVVDRSDHAKVIEHDDCDKSNVR